ncbi:RAxF-45 family protein [Salinibacillus xinjiangensis]|nr:RAxF-45 family protein [Salinibacillus xinjiangensis]
MINACKHVIQINKLYLNRAITHDFAANGIRMPFFSN